MSNSKYETGPQRGYARAERAMRGDDVGEYTYRGQLMAGDVKISQATFDDWHDMEVAKAITQERVRLANVLKRIPDLTMERKQELLDLIFEKGTLTAQ